MLVDTWAAQHTAAATADHWKTALSKWNSHLGSIRKQRSRALQDLVSPAVDTLLGDVGIRLAVLAVNKGGIKLVLRNDLDHDVELSHLSAGQRNALLLGPVIGTAANGTFGFRLIDDPVHAFDDFRVDRLSATVAAMGQDQSLVLTTHDGRFVEYLRVHAPAAIDVLRIARDSQGQITVFRSDAPWQVLLEHAAELHKMAAASLTNEGIASIRVLLRMCVDESLETAFLRHAGTLDPDDRATRREIFDGAMTLSKRHTVLRKGLSGPIQQAFTAATQSAVPYFGAWSKSIHGLSATPSGMPDSSANLVPEITAARTTCEALEVMGWA